MQGGAILWQKTQIQLTIELLRPRIQFFQIKVHSLGPSTPAARIFSDFNEARGAVVADYTAVSLSYVFCDKYKYKY